MPLILGANSATAGGLTVPNSCRFNTADSANVYWTPGGVGNRRKWTWSGWGKINAVEALSLFSAASGTSYCECSRNVSGVLDFVNVNSGVLTGRRQLSQLFRDPSAWMHFCLVWDSDNATALQQMRVYINGTEVTDFALTTNPAGTDSVMNNTVRTNVGSSNGGGPFMAGYLADVCFIDGLALTPTSFGEFDTDTPTVFKPIDVSGLTFGTNGFHLDFQDSADLGNDAAGSNNLTSGGLAATDQCTDTPDNNFATLNPLDNFYAGSAFAQGNCQATQVAGGVYGVNTSTIGLTKGKWYFEAVYTTTNDSLIGITDKPQLSAGAELGDTATQWSIYGNGSSTLLRNNNAQITWGASFAQGAVVGVAIDMDNLRLYFANANTWMNSGDPTDGTGKIDITTSTGVVFPAVGAYGNTPVWQVNFGGCSAFDLTTSPAETDADGYGNFEFAPPSGYFAICTKNLAEYG